MEITDIITAISTVGFPIAAYIMLFVYQNKQLKELQDIIIANTSAINKLIDSLD